MRKSKSSTACSIKRAIRRKHYINPSLSPFLHQISASITLFLLTVLRSNAQTCLSSPPAVTHNAVGNDVEWTEIGPNTFATTLVFDVSTKEWPDASMNARIRTRLFNDSFPSQTLRFERGKQYIVSAINALGAESEHNPTQNNVPKDPNTTNVHTHGLHISGDERADSVFGLSLSFSAETVPFARALCTCTQSS